MAIFGYIIQHANIINGPIDLNESFVDIDKYTNKHAH